MSTLAGQSPYNILGNTLGRNCNAKAWSCQDYFVEAYDLRNIH
jgi:hypothetical protein